MTEPKRKRARGYVQVGFYLDELEQLYETYPKRGQLAEYIRNLVNDHFKPTNGTSESTLAHLTSKRENIVKKVLTPIDTEISKIKKQIKVEKKEKEKELLDQAFTEEAIRLLTIEEVSSDHYSSIQLIRCRLGLPHTLVSRSPPPRDSELVKKLEVIKSKLISGEIPFDTSWLTMGVDAHRAKMIRDAIKNVVSYQNPEEVLEDLRDILKIKDASDEKTLLKVTRKFWVEFRGE